MKTLLAIIFVLGLTSCDDFEVQGHEAYVEMTDRIIKADNENQSYMTLTNKYGGVMEQVVNDVAIPDGWEPVGGRTAHSYGQDGIFTDFSQSLKKTNKDSYLVRVGDKLKLRSHLKEYK